MPPQGDPSPLFWGQGAGTPVHDVRSLRHSLSCRALPGSRGLPIGTPPTPASSRAFARTLMVSSLEATASEQRGNMIALDLHARLCVRPHDRTRRPHHRARDGVHRDCCCLHRMLSLNKSTSGLPSSWGLADDTVYVTEIDLVRDPIPAQPEVTTTSRQPRAGMMRHFSTDG